MHPVQICILFTYSLFVPEVWILRDCTYTGAAVRTTHRFKLVHQIGAPNWRFTDHQFGAPILKCGHTNWTCFCYVSAYQQNRKTVDNTVRSQMTTSFFGLLQ